MRSQMEGRDFEKEPTKRMKISELIEALERFQEKHGDVPVMTDGYEGGNRDLSEGDFEVEHVLLEENCEWYYGPHESALKEHPEAIKVLSL